MAGGSRERKRNKDRRIDKKNGEGRRYETRMGFHNRFKSIDLTFLQ